MKPWKIGSAKAKLLTSGELADAGLINGGCSAMALWLNPVARRSNLLDVVLAELVVAAVAVLDGVVNVAQVKGGYRLCIC